MEGKKYIFFVILFLFNGCSFYSSNNFTEEKKKLTNVPPTVLLLASFISPTPYDGQNEPAVRLVKKKNAISYDDKEVNVVDFQSLPTNQQDILLYIFKYTNTRINRKEVVISTNENFAVKEIKKMMMNNKRVTDLPNSKIRKKWGIIVDRLKKTNGFKNQNPKIFLIINKYKIRDIMSETFNIQGVLVSPK